MGDVRYQKSDIWMAVSIAGASAPHLIPEGGETVRGDMNCLMHVRAVGNRTIECTYIEEINLRGRAGTRASCLLH